MAKSIRGMSSPPIWLVASLLLVFLIVSFPTISKAAEKMPLWKRVGSWDVRVDKTLGYGCFTMAEYEGGTVFRIGFNREGLTKGYIIVGNQKWKSLEVGKEYTVTLKFDNAEPWRGDATGFKFDKGDTGTFLFLHFSHADLFRDFMRKTSLEIKYKKKRITLLTLKGSGKALVEMLKCQKAMNIGGSKSSSQDPFASGTKSSSDPFAN